MDINEFKRNAYLFDPKDYGRIYAFVDFANVRHWAKNFWPAENKEFFRREIDINALASVINWVSPAKKFFYYGHYKPHPELPPEHAINIRNRQSEYRLDKARKAGFRVRTKEIKEINDYDDEGRFLGKLCKCNFDIEMATDMLLKIHKYDTVFLWSGDSDFHFLLQYLKSQKKRVVTICARSFASDELVTYFDKFIPADSLKETLEYKPVHNANPGH